MTLPDFASLLARRVSGFVLRPGPYVCGEREWGGYPWWLSQVHGIIIRDNNKPFLDASENYIANLARDLKHLQVTERGPILMVQVENEYGSFGDDMDYKIAMRDMVKKHFDFSLYTTEGGAKSVSRRWLYFRSTC
jgi:beta-galactosidase GanA